MEEQADEESNQQAYETIEIDPNLEFQYSQDEASEDEVGNGSKQGSSTCGSSATKRKKDNTEQETRKKTKAERAFAWKHFTKLDVDGKATAKCNHCLEIFSALSTTSLNYHLEKKHKIVDPNKVTSKTKKDAAKSPPKVGTRRGFQTKLTQGFMGNRSPAFIKGLTRRITEMLAFDMLPADFVSGLGFRRMMAYAVPGYKVPHRTTFTRTHIPDLKKDVDKLVQEDLKEADHLSHTTDCWTDNFKHNSYMAVTSHFISKDWQMKAYCLATAIIKGSVTGNVIAGKMDGILQKFGLENKPFTAVTDQGANILKAGRLEDWHHLNCLLHKINNCLMKDGLNATSGFKELLKKCIDIVKALRYKGPEVIAKQQELKDFMENFVEDDHNYSNVTLEIGTKSLKQHQKTRWNSIATMIESILDNRAVLDDLFRGYNKYELILRPQEIAALKMLLNFLAPFKTIGTALQADLYPTLSQVWPSVCLLKKKCRIQLAQYKEREDKETQAQQRVAGDSSAEENGDGEDLDDDQEGATRREVPITSIKYEEAMKCLCENVLAALEKRFPDTRQFKELFLLTTSLDPRFKGFPEHFKTPEEYEVAIKGYLRKVKVDPTDFLIEEEDASAKDSSCSSSTFVTIFGELIDEFQSGSTNSESKLCAEVHAYLAFPKLQQHETEKFKLLDWWKKNEKVLPLLSKVARAVHAIVATSASSERMFSKGGNVVSAKRSNISPSNVDRFVCLHQNLRTLLASGQYR